MNTNRNIRTAGFFAALISLSTLGNAETLLEEDFTSGREGWHGSGQTGSVSTPDGTLRITRTQTGQGNFPMLVRHFPPVDLQVGQRLEIKFTAQKSGMSAWRSGIYNSGGSKILDDNFGTERPGFKDWTGYDVNHSATSSDSDDNSIWVRSGGAGNLYSEMPAELQIVPRQNLHFEKCNNDIANDVAFPVSMTIDYQAADAMVITTTFNGQSVSTTDTNPVTTTFDTFATWGYLPQNGWYSLDEVRLQVTDDQGDSGR